MSKVAAVTGGASGIGRAIVAALAARGDLVVVLDIAEPAASGGPGAGRAHVATDVGDEAQVEAAFATIDGRFGRLDVLVNCAGVDIATPIVDTPADEWERVQRVNATGVFLCTRAAARRMVARGTGCIVSVSSINAHLGWRSRSAYSASKGAIEAFSRAAAELGPFGIRVNVVAPGSIETPLWGGTLTAAARSAHAARTVLGRIGSADEVAGAVAYLTSDEARYVTGIVLPVCGGRSTIDYVPG